MALVYALNLALIISQTQNLLSSKAVSDLLNNPQI